MAEKTTRREMLGNSARALALLGLGGTAAYLTTRSGRANVWQIDIQKCLNSQVGHPNLKYCDLCATECVLQLSAVRAVNEFSLCGRCYICPAYYDIKSRVGQEGLPSQKLCPRDAIERKPIGYVDPQDPANNYYEYLIDENRCNGCGKCVLGCKEPAGLGSIVLEVRYNLCIDCNRCLIASACPEDAYLRDVEGTAQTQLKKEAADSR